MSSKAKEAAARYLAGILVDELAKATRIGIGTGSTVRLVIDYLASDSEARRLLDSRKLYASSFDTILYLQGKGLEASSMLPPSPLDVYFDGADEVAVHQGLCQAVKGRGAAHTREKILAFMAKRVYLVVDYTKLSRKLGEKNKPVPVEVVPDAIPPVVELLETLGVKPKLRTCNCRDGPTITDNYGAIIDTWPWERFEPFRYEGILDTIPGVIGHGLFIGYMDAIIVGWEDRAVLLKCKRTRRIDVHGSWRKA